MTLNVNFDRIGDWGLITLNNPRALNALTLDMVRAIHDQVKNWETDDRVKALMLRGEGERAFCAGADIKALAAYGRDNPECAFEFFRTEYQNNVRLFQYSKPIVSMIGALVMGGGVGLSLYGSHRIVSERTVFAMPETGIGLFPDVGGSHFLSRMDDGVGLYFGLTGARGRGRLYCGRCWNRFC